VSYPPSTDPPGLVPDPAVESAGTPESILNQQASRPLSFSQMLRAPRQALSGVLNGVFGSQSPDGSQESDVKYPTLPSLIRKEGSMPGAFPESPQKGTTSIELPQAAGIGSEMSTTRPATLVLESRGTLSSHPRG
jgi:hypothetical protein